MSLYKYAKSLAEAKKEREHSKYVAGYMPLVGAAGAATGATAAEYAKKTGDVQLKGTSSKIKRVDQRQYHLQRYRTDGAKAAFRSKVGKSAVGAAVLGALGGVAAKHMTRSMADAKYNYERAKS